MNKTIIQNKLEKIKWSINRRQDQVIKFKDIVNEIEDELSDLTLEESELELELAKMEEDDELSTKPWSHADDENDQER